MTVVFVGEYTYVCMYDTKEGHHLQQHLLGSFFFSWFVSPKHFSW